MGGKSSNSKRTKGGLAYWLARVPELVEETRADFSPDNVHDLRVAIRNCRSMGDGLSQVVPHDAWKQLDRAGKLVFKALGNMRDTHVLLDWVESLAPGEDSVKRWARDFFTAREEGLLPRAREALQAFDADAWNRCAALLSPLASEIESGYLVFQHLAMQRLEVVEHSHRRAMDGLRLERFHSLRVDVKRLRYTVENFLPGLKKNWGKSLKKVQDLLGECNDLDILTHILQEHVESLDGSDFANWEEIIEGEINRRLESYIALAEGDSGLLYEWRNDLPKGPDASKVAVRAIRVFASHIDSQFEHTRRIARLARDFYDGLANCGASIPTSHPRARDILRVAGLMHGVVRDEKNEPDLKASAKRLRGMTTPAGWSDLELKLAALVVRFCGGDAVEAEDKAVAKLPAYARWLVRSLSGILRFARALDSEGGEPIKGVQCEFKGEILQIQFKGFKSCKQRDENLVKDKELLERVLGKPIHILPE